MKPKEAVDMVGDLRRVLDELDEQIETAFKTVDALKTAGNKRAETVGLAIIGLRKAIDHYHQTIRGAFELMLDSKCYIAAFSLRIDEYSELLKTMAKEAGIPEPEPEPVPESTPQKPTGKKAKQ